MDEVVLSGNPPGKNSQKCIFFALVGLSNSWTMAVLVDPFAVVLNKDRANRLIFFQKMS